MPSLPAALKGYDFLIALEISSTEITMGEGIAAGYEELGMSVRSASGIGGTDWDFRASAFSGGVGAIPEGVTSLGMVGGVRGRWLCSLAHFSRSQISLHPLAAYATARLKYAAFVFLMAVPLALSASR